MSRPGPISAFAALVLSSAAASAAVPTPEIQRPAVSAQAINAVHTVRTIPEACARLEGMFVAGAAVPYALKPVKTSPKCQGRARFVDGSVAKPSASTGWILNDVVRIPSAACASQQAVINVWRKPASNTPPAKDAQGRARIYLKDASDSAKANTLDAIAQYAAVLQIQGNACR